MTIYFTPNDQLIRYVYQEMSEEESIEFEQLLREDDGLMQDYLGFLSTIDQINGLMLEPSDKVVANIKEKAKTSGLQKV